jgi:hypothetical protein
MSASFLSTRTFVLGSVAAVELACVLGIACLGRGLVPVEAVASGPNRGPDPTSPELATSAVVEDANRAEPVRIALPVLAPAGEDECVSPAARAREPRTESEFCSVFRSVAAGGLAPLEVAVRRALIEPGPTCRRVAALRVLGESNSSATDEILAAAIARSTEGADRGDDVPRYALHALVARSAGHPESRRLLESMTWGDGETLSPALRATAASTLASSAGEAEIDRIANCLQREQDPLVRAGTIEALGRRTPSPARDRALERLGIPPVARIDGGGERDQENY